MENFSFILTPQWLATLIMLVCYVVLFSEKMNRAVTTLIAAMFMILSGILTQAEAFEGVDFNTISLLVHRARLRQVDRRLQSSLRGEGVYRLPSRPRLSRESAFGARRGLLYGAHQGCDGERPRPRDRQALSDDGEVYRGGLRPPPRRDRDGGRQAVHRHQVRDE